MRRRLAVLITSTLFVCGLAVAQEPAKTPDQKPAGAASADLAQDQAIISRKYENLRLQLLKIADRLKKSGTTEGVRKGMAIEKALNQANVNNNIPGLFEDLNKLLAVPSLNNLEKAVKEGKDVTGYLQQLLEDLLSDSEADQIDFLKNMLKELEAAIYMEKAAIAKNMSPNVDKDDAAKAQEAATARVQDLLKRIQDYETRMGRGPKPGEPKDGQQGQDKKEGESKDGKDGKGGEDKARKNDKDGKGDGKDGKSGDKNDKDSKGEPKDGKGNDKSKKDGKSGDQAGKDGKSGDQNGKDSKSGDKDSKGESKDGKGDQQKDSKGAEKGDNQQGQQDQNKKDGQGQQGQGQKGQPKKGGQGGEGGGDSQDQQEEKQQQQQQQQDEDQGGVPGRERIKDANNDQRNAGDKIKKDRRTDALPDQQEATRKLEEARKRLEEILRQKREEERERVLQDLKERCEKMKRMQEVVKENTIQLEQKIKARPDRKPNRDLEKESNQQATEEDNIIAEADKAILILETEGSSVAFTEVFKQVRNDMTHVSRRLSRTDVGPETQLIEQDIIDTLGEMIEALKQQIKQNRDRKDNPPPPSDNNQLKNLINLLAELRMIRSLQLRVNNRTSVWGQRYKGELAELPEIVQELRDLGVRQHRIYQMTDHLAKGRNR